MKQLASTFTLLLCSLPAVALAQAWVPPPTTLSLGLSYSFSPSTAIVESDGVTLEPVNTTQHTTLLSAEFVPLEGLGIRAFLPMMGIKADANAAQHDDHGRFDDGKLHLTLQDLRVDVRYAPIAVPVAASVMVGGSIPVADYPVMGEASAGRGLKQLHLGVALGATFDPFLPDLYVHARYEFSLVERFETDAPITGEQNQNRHDMSFQVGYYILEELEVNLGVDLRIPMGGFEYITYDADDTPQALRDFHDPLMKEGVFLVGGGGSYAITEALSVDAIVRIFLGGQNTRNAHTFGLGLTWEVF